MAINNLKVKRLSLGLTQAELAQKSKLSERQVQRIEKGFQNPKLSTIKRLAATLNTTTEDLFPLAEEASPSPK